jgi:hypothetical protein
MMRRTGLCGSVAVLLVSGVVAVAVLDVVGALVAVVLAAPFDPAASAVVTHIARPKSATTLRGMLHRRSM